MTAETQITVNALPTKDFFISMLTRDIDLTSAISDLVDNSIDDARRIRKTGDYSDLVVKIEVNKGYFQISDNCGGIAIEDAKDYAFRFGRPSKVHTRNSIGQFGIGMKRALFKMGREFRVESKTASAHFVVQEDVDDWNTRHDDWNFNLREIEPSPSDIPDEEYGTVIRVDRLYANVSAQFILSTFRSQLKIELERSHQMSIISGLGMTLNGEPLEFKANELLESNEIQPAFREIEYGDVRAKIYAGVSASHPTDAGWYIYCNGRLVLEADKTSVTGWGEGGERTIPRYHNQYARFRGYVLFDADNPQSLPWKTTKDGVETDSAVYRAARRDMIAITRPVITFLNRVKEEADSKNDERPLDDAIRAANKVAIGEITIRETFHAPDAKPSPPGPKMNTITYKKPASQVERVKAAFDVSRMQDVGARTFEYFYENECGEE